MWEKFFEIVADAVAAGLRNSKSSNSKGPTFKDRIETVRNQLREGIIQSQVDSNALIRLAAECSSAAQAVREIGLECESKRDNMPDQLQDCGTGELLQVRADECSNIAESLDRASAQIHNLDPSQLSDAVRIIMAVQWDHS